MNLKLESRRQEIPGRTLGRDGPEGLHPRKVGEFISWGDPPRRFGGGAREDSVGHVEQKVAGSQALKTPRSSV